MIKVTMPKSFYQTDFQLVGENFLKAIETTSSNSTLLLTVLVIYIDLFGKMLYAVNNQRAGTKLLKEIGVRYPYFCWEVFRNGCTHNSYPNIIEINNYSIDQIWWSTSYRNIATIETALSKKTEITNNVDIVVKSERNILYKIDINNLLENLLFFLKKKDTSKLKAPRIKSIKDISNKEILEDIYKIITDVN